MGGGFGKDNCVPSDASCDFLTPSTSRSTNTSHPSEEVEREVLTDRVKSPDNDEMTIAVHSREKKKHDDFTIADADARSGPIYRSNFVVDRVGSSINKYYHLDKMKLGQGTYGSVCRGIHISTGHCRAVKIIIKGRVKSVRRLREEIEIMKGLDHPNIVKLYETFEDKKFIYLVMEICRGGELFELVKARGHLDERFTAFVMKQLFGVIHYLRNCLVIHRDIKPENLLFSSSSLTSPLKLIDFGLSLRCSGEGVHMVKAGTPHYIAPEILNGFYSFSCDDWSAGVILFVLLSGCFPFSGDSDATVLSEVRKGVVSFVAPEWEGVSLEAKDLISRLLTVKPANRMTSGEALQHPWILHLTREDTKLDLPKSMVRNLKYFGRLNKFQKAALTIIAQFLTDDKEIDKLKRVFTALDVDRSGTLSFQEVLEGFRRLGCSLPPDMSRITAGVDSDGSGYIDYTEFIAAAMDHKTYLKKLEILRAAFAVFDIDNNGRITHEELRVVLGLPAVGCWDGRELVKSLVDEVDLNGDGEVDFEEFIHMMCQKGEVLKDYSYGILNPAEAKQMNLSDIRLPPPLYATTDRYKKVED